MEGLAAEAKEKEEEWGRQKAELVGAWLYLDPVVVQAAVYKPVGLYCPAFSQGEGLKPIRSLQEDQLRSLKVRNMEAERLFKVRGSCRIWHPHSTAISAASVHCQLIFELCIKLEAASLLLSQAYSRAALLQGDWKMVLLQALALACT